jgi:hypothetical protein
MEQTTQRRIVAEKTRAPRFGARFVHGLFGRTLKLLYRDLTARGPRLYGDCLFLQAAVPDILPNLRIYKPRRMWYH